jgi:hypothetical protein
MTRHGSPRILLGAARWLLCVLLAVGYVGCIGAANHVEERTGEAVLEREFKVHYGQELTVKGHDLNITFASVLDDSRCPAHVKCVWEGDAKILMRVKQANAEESQLELHTNPRFTQQGDYQQYVIRLVALDPHPSSYFKTPQHDYIATLLVRKA